MNFNLQPTMNMNDQPSQTFHPSVGTGYFAEQPLLRNGYPASSYISRFSGYFPNPIDSSGAIQIEIEKERIREGVILAEIARRRMFDEELLRELRLGRNLVGGFLSSSSMMSNHGSLPSEPSSLGERLISSFEKRSEFPVPVPVRRFDGSSESMQMFQRSSQHRVSTVNLLPSEEKHMSIQSRPSSENRVSTVDLLLEGANEGKPKSMYKPQVNLFRLKRKADSPLLIGDDDEPTSSTSSKKTSFKNKSNFCSLCQVGATCKKNLNDHLKGKKHKASVLRLRQKHEKKNYEIGLFPKKNYEIGLFPKTGVEKQETNPVSVFVGEEAVVRMKNDLPLFRSEVPLQCQKKMIVHKRGKKNHLRKSSTTSRKR